jgi:hypothetical protein
MRRGNSARGSVVKVTSPSVIEMPIFENVHVLVRCSPSDEVTREVPSNIPITHFPSSLVPFWKV